MLKKCRDCDLLHVGEAAEGGRACAVPALFALFEGVALSERERAHLRWLARMQVADVFVPLITKLKEAKPR